jgi:hypothetical protein
LNTELCFGFLQAILGMAEVDDSLDQVPFKFSAYSLDQTADQKKSYASKLQRNGVNDCP